MTWLANSNRYWNPALPTRGGTALSRFSSTPRSATANLTRRSLSAGANAPPGAPVPDLDATDPAPAARTRPAPDLPGTTAARTDAEQRWSIARRLVTDDTLDPADRVAAALVVLYAQTLSRIVALTTEHIQRDGDTVCLQLGTEGLELAEPFATLIQSLPLRRRHGIVEQLPTTWLFPGRCAGRPLRAVALGNRMRELGIQPQRMRLAALDQLTKEVPPAMLAGVLGIPASTTVGTTSRSGGDWTRYAAGRRT